MDPGIDDAVALMYALLHPKINVVGIVSGYGNVSKEDAILNTAYILKLAGREDIPIIGGATGPVTGEISTFYPEIHGNTLGPIQAPKSLKAKVYRLSKAVELIEQYKGNIVVVATGRLTELAILFILNPTEMNEYISRFYVMGGVFLMPGNVTAVAEANFYGDPIAASVFMTKAENVYLFPLNVTHRAIVKPQTAQAIAAKSKNPFKPLFLPIYEYYYKAYQKLLPGIEGTPIHDILPLMGLVNDKVVQYVQRAVNVQISGKARGESIADFRPTAEEKDKNAEQYIGWAIDYDEFIKELTTILTSPLPNSKT
ncbi:nucleoside hydrolase [Priestia megaterium]|nr:nucleoside hydrolase [Priestia megaterium]